MQVKLLHELKKTFHFKIFFSIFSYFKNKDEIQIKGAFDFL